MKVLFLDIDGVLNNFSSRNFGEQFSPSSCACLKEIMDAVPELKVVVSSAWRIHGLAYMQRVLDKNGVDSTRVIDCTGREQGFRGHQIQCWLDRNPGTTNMVILDDDSDMGALMNKLVKTRSFKGLTQDEVPLVLDVLKKPMN